jgi:hypothetical protein
LIKSQIYGKLGFSQLSHYPIIITIPHYLYSYTSHQDTSIYTIRLTYISIQYIITSIIWLDQITYGSDRRFDHPCLRSVGDCVSATSAICIDQMSATVYINLFIIHIHPHSSKQSITRLFHHTIRIRPPPSPSSSFRISFHFISLLWSLGIHPLSPCWTSDILGSLLFMVKTSYWLII